MDKKNLMPQVAQPINRTITGQLPTELAELSEEALQVHGDADVSSSVLTSQSSCNAIARKMGWCSYDGDDAE